MAFFAITPVPTTLPTVTVGGKQGVVVPVLVPGQPLQARFVPIAEQATSFFRPQKERVAKTVTSAVETTKTLIAKAPIARTRAQRAVLGSAGAGLLGASLLGLGPAGVVVAAASTGLLFLIRRK